MGNERPHRVGLSVLLHSHFWTLLWGQQEGWKEFEQGLTPSEVERDSFGLMQKAGRVGQKLLEGRFVKGYSDVGLFKET